MFMTSGCLGGIGCALVVLAIGVAPAAAAEPVGDPPAAMYEPGTVDVIRLTLPPESKQKLEEAPEVDYVEGTFSIASTEGTPETTGEFSPPATVGIRLKGGIGSFRELSEKASFKIKFNFENSKGEKGKKYLGLKKLTLNNMVQDKSFIHERLAYEAFRSAGVPSPRTGYAYVEVNGEDFGLHLNIEALDDVALEKRFGPFAHLYEAIYGSDIHIPSTPFEIDEGDESDTSDLDALIAAVNGTEPADFEERVQAYADLAEMARLWAVEHYIGHWDAYIWLNNYYLLSDLQGRFQMLPWGTDQTWVEHLPFDEGEGVMFTECLQNATCAARYRKGLRVARAAVEGRSLDTLASETAALLKPWEEMEQSNSRHEASMSAIGAAVQGTRNFIATRPAELEAWLADKPEPLATHVSLALEPASVPADGAASSTATATVTYGDGSPVTGDWLEFSSPDPNIQFGEVVDNGDGTYTAEVTASTSAGAKTITATDAVPVPHIAGSAVLSQAPLAATGVSVTLQPAAIVADGATISTATATVTDTHGNPIAGHQVEFTSTDPGQQIGSVVDHGDGAYTAQITSSKAVGTATITASDTSAAPLSGSASLTQVPIPLVLESDSAAGNPAPSQAPDLLKIQAPVAPNATLTGKPSKRSRDRRPTFRFASDLPGSRFQCRLDKGAFRSCKSPHTLPMLALGAHIFSVRAVSAAGLIGPAASYAFTVRPARSHRHPAGRARPT
jgi:hypothetical protein